jgi:hypothetical protein
MMEAGSGKAFVPQPIPTPDPNNWWARMNPEPPVTHYQVQLMPHSYRVFTFEK